MIAYILFLLLFQEVTFRFFFPLPELSNFDRINYMRLAEVEGQFAHLRDQPWYWESSPDTAHQFLHDMNRYGFRGSEWSRSKPAGKARAIFVGDSFVEGIMAEHENTIPRSFEMASTGQFEVFNGGMMGAGLDAYLQLATDVLPIFQPDYLFLCISTNDLTQRVPRIPDLYLSAKAYPQAKPRLLELLHQWQGGSPVRFRFDAGARPYIPSVASSANPWSTKEEQLQDHVNADIASAMRAGTFSPFRTNNLYNEAQNLSRSPALGEAIPYLQYFCREFKARPVVVYIPSRNLTTTYYYPFEREFCQILCDDSLDLTGSAYQVHQHALAEECRRHNVSFIDLTGFVRDHEQRGRHLYWKYDDHMRGEGYRLLGQEIYRRIRERVVAE